MTPTPSRHTRWALRGGLEALAGGLGYGALELVWRGYTHISMILAGAVCLPFLVYLSRSRRNLLLLSLTGGLAITGVELAIGCVVNLWLGLEVWDYTHESLHLWGQVCVRFTLLWCLLCAVLLPLCRWLRRGFFHLFPHRAGALPLLVSHSSAESRSR